MEPSSLTKVWITFMSNFPSYLIKRTPFPAFAKKCYYALFDKSHLGVGVTFLRNSFTFLHSNGLKKFITVNEYIQFYTLWCEFCRVGRVGFIKFPLYKSMLKKRRIHAVIWKESLFEVEAWVHNYSEGLFTCGEASRSMDHIWLLLLSFWQDLSNRAL